MYSARNSQLTLLARNQLMFLFAVVAFCRLLCLCVEFGVLDSVQTRCERRVAAEEGLGEGQGKRELSLVAEKGEVSPRSVEVSQRTAKNMPAFKRVATAHVLATQTGADVADAAASVFNEVPLSFIAVAFFMGVSSVVFGLNVVAWLPTNGDIKIELIL